LGGVTLEVTAGSFAAILGPSGCGKSTLLRLIAGLESLDMGEVRIGGIPISGVQPVGMVFQSYSSFPWLTVRGNVEFALKVVDRRLSIAERKERVEATIRLVGLEEFESYYPIALSGGMKQRLALARALATEPPLLLLDEPFGALDAQTRVLLQEQLMRLWTRLDTTVCLVTHDVEEALLLADVIYILGGRPARVQHKLSNPFPEPRDWSLRTDPTFLREKSNLFEQIRQDAVGALGGSRQPTRRRCHPTDT
jgi:NitT/TauT family transport system ATP-binding protein